MNENGTLSAADVRSVVDASNDRGFNGYGYPMPVMPMYGGYGNGFGSGFGDGSWIWLILILALFGGFNGNGGFGNGFNNDYAWLSNGQKDIMQNTNEGFNTLQLANQLTQANSGIQNLSTQLCNCCADVNSNLCNGFAGVNATVNAGFANAETAANGRQMANMQQLFSNQLSTVQGLNGINTAIASTGCDIREGIAGVNYNNAIQTQQLSSLIASENCADRAAIQEGVRDLLTNQTANTQRILDQLCQDKIDAKNEKIDDLQREILMKDLQASQIAQTAQLRAGQVEEVDALYNRLSSCPVPTTPVYGRTPIFTCNNNGCGCGNTFGNTLV